MNMSIENNLKILAQKEGMDDISLFFRQYETFEEIPVFSFFDNINFLSEMSFNEKNKVLIKHAIILLKTIKEFEKRSIDENKNKYFFCVSIRDWDIDDYEEINCVTPCVYISTRKTWLASYPKLIERNTVEENLILEYLSSIGEAGFKVRRACSDKEITRVYIL